MAPGAFAFEGGQPSTSNNAVLGAGSGSSGNDARHLLAQSGAIIYSTNRYRQDNCWTVAYCLMAALTVFWGIASFTQTNPYYGQYPTGFYRNSTDCNYDNYMDIVGDDAWESDDSESSSNSSYSEAMQRAVNIFLPITAVVGILGAIGYVKLFQKYPKFMVRTAVIASILLTIFWAVLCILNGIVAFGVFVLLFAAFMAVGYWYMRAQLDLVAELLGMAGRGLHENKGLWPAAIGIKLAGGGVLTYMFAALVCTFWVGSTGQTPGVAKVHGENGVGYCTTSDGYLIDCCADKPQPAWTGWYVFFNIITLLWTAQLVLQIKLYTVADTIAQWYFASPAAGGASISSSAAVADPKQPAGPSVKLALRHCLTSGFGTVAFAAAILTLLRIIRRTLERAARNNIFCCILNCILQPLLAIAQRFTQFSTISAAITGQAFVPAAKTVFGTLTRNLLQSYGVWWVPELVVNMTVLLLTFSWSAFVFVLAYASTGDLRDDYSGDAYGIATNTAVYSFLLMWFVLYFAGSLLLDIVNTLYVCYAMDRDARTVSRPEVHVLYQKLPSVQGSIVQNPDGAVLYGAPDAAPAPAAAPAPPAGYSAITPPAYPGYPPVAAPGGAYPAIAPAGYMATASQPPSYDYSSNKV